jgi:hypothetical protein
MPLPRVRLNAAQKACLVLMGLAAGILGYAIATRPTNNGAGDVMAVALPLLATIFALAGTFHAAGRSRGRGAACCRRAAASHASSEQ